MRDSSDHNINNFKNTLSGFCWANVTNDKNPETAYDTFHENISDLYNLFFQPKTIRFNKNIHKVEKWMTKGLLISRQTKLSLEKNYAQNPSVANCEKYKSYRNLYNTTVRLCKKKYYSDELEQSSKNLIKTWSLLNEVLRKSNSKQPINSLFHKGKLLTDPTLIANAFNHYFTTIADEIAKQINPTTLNGEPIDDSYDDFVTNTGRHCFNLADKPATDDEILMCIRKLEDKKTLDMMRFSSYLLKKVSYSLLTPLRHIFNRSFVTGRVPSKMKIAK